MYNLEMEYVNPSTPKYLKEKNIFRLAMATMGFIFLLLFVSLIVGYADTHYKQTAEVLSVEDNSLFLVDSVGNVWEIKDNSLHKGQFVELYFHNNNTTYTQKDDIIIKVKRLDN